MKLKSFNYFLIDMRYSSTQDMKQTFNHATLFLITVLLANKLNKHYLIIYFSCTLMIIGINVSPYLFCFFWIIILVPYIMILFRLTETTLIPNF